MDLAKRNKNNVISRWKKVHDSEREMIVYDSKYISRICGFLAGDGCLVESRSSIRFFPDDESLIGPYVEAMKKVYNKIPSVIKKKNHYEVSITSKVMFEDLVKYCKFSTKKWNLPLEIFKSDEDIIEWIRAFFDAEAHVNMHAKNIKVSSINKDGLIEVKEALIKLGIHSKIYEYSPKNERWSTNYLLIIGRKADLFKYRENIGFNHKSKLSKLYKLA